MEESNFLDLARRHGVTRTVSVLQLALGISALPTTVSLLAALHPALVPHTWSAWVVCKFLLAHSAVHGLAIGLRCRIYLKLWALRASKRRTLTALRNVLESLEFRALEWVGSGANWMFILGSAMAGFARGALGDDQSELSRVLLLSLSAAAAKMALSAGLFLCAFAEKQVTKTSAARAKRRLRLEGAQGVHLYRWSADAYATRQAGGVGSTAGGSCEEPTCAICLGDFKPAAASVVPSSSGPVPASETAASSAIADALAAGSYLARATAALGLPGLAGLRYRGPVAAPKPAAQPVAAPLVAELRCSPLHTYHAACLSQWLDTKPTCPLCGVGVDLETVSEDEEDEEGGCSGGEQGGEGRRAGGMATPPPPAALAGPAPPPAAL